MHLLTLTRMQNWTLVVIFVLFAVFVLSISIGAVRSSVVVHAGRGSTSLLPSSFPVIIVVLFRAAGRG